MAYGGRGGRDDSLHFGVSLQCGAPNFMSPLVAVARNYFRSSNTGVRGRGLGLVCTHFYSKVLETRWSQRMKDNPRHIYSKVNPSYFNGTYSKVCIRLSF